MANKSVQTLLTEVNSWIETNLSYEVQFYTECYLYEKDGKTRPMKRLADEEGEYISYDRSYPLQIYHRLLDYSSDQDETQGFGSKAYVYETYTFRLVGIGWTDKIGDQNYELNPDVAYQVKNSLPNNLGDANLLITDINTNKHDIINEEWAGNDFKELSLGLVCFTIDYEIKQRANCTTLIEP